jgi:predicted TIM-barrel fold metal-dependent hydrolase
MRRVYELAAELRVPVLIHFQDFPQFEGDGTYNAGITRLPAILKAYPKTTFIGHGDSFWANISADVPEGVSYPTGGVKPGGLTDRMLSDFPNLYGDLSANSGRNALGRDPDFAGAFLARHAEKLMFGCDCSCTDGSGTGQRSQQPLIKGKCVARETLTALKQLASAERFRKITWDNGRRLLKIPA